MLGVIFERSSKISQEPGYNGREELVICSDLLNKLGMISLGGGLPSSEYFPFESIEIKVPTPPHFSEKETKVLGTVAKIGKHDATEGKSLYGIMQNVPANNIANNDSQIFTLHSIMPNPPALRRCYAS